MAQLSIDLSAIKANYNALKGRVGNACEVSAVVKANAYGLGVGAVASALQQVGCKTFFIATLTEALELRMILGHDPDIAMLNGFDISNAKLYTENKIIPVINSLPELQSFKAQNNDLMAMLHINTGMNRLGLNPDVLNADIINGLNLRAIMSHLASSEDKDNPANLRQAKAFKEITQNYQGVQKSLCNSSGIFLDESYHFDLARPGMALYGLNPTPYLNNPMQQAVKLNAKILQTRTAQKGETVGYNETYSFDEKTRLAVIDIGYADGIHRTLSNNGCVYYDGIACPIRGNVSMDLTIIDLNNIPENKTPSTGDMVEIIGPNQSADDLAKSAGTIGYEVLTSLGNRCERLYINP